MEKVFQSKFNYLSAIIVLCLTAYFAYLFIESSFSLVILLTLSYILLAKIVKYSYFKESSLEVRFPLNFIGKRIVIDYKDVKSVETGAGSYLDGSILVIRYFRGDSLKKMIVEMLKADDWTFLKERLLNHEIEIKERK